MKIVFLIIHDNLCQDFKTVDKYYCNIAVGILQLIYKEKKYERIEKKCPVCSKVFTAKKGSPKEKVTCSYSCSNTHFRSGEDNPNWKNEAYRSTCFAYHKKKCVVCEEDRILDVHHYDKNHSNNNPENLIPLCPTHHMYIHSRYKELISDEVDKYVNDFKKVFLKESKVLVYSVSFLILSLF